MPPSAGTQNKIIKIERICPQNVSINIRGINMGEPIYPALRRRYSLRLKGYDYSSIGTYYVTICVKDRENIFGEIRRDKIILNENGIIVRDYWNDLKKHFLNIKIGSFVIMPDHIHGIISIVGAGFPRPEYVGRGDRAPTLGDIVAYFKYGTTRDINFNKKTPGMHLWQRNYYEHIIRNESELNEVREYIINNPLKSEIFLDKFM